MKLKEKYDDYYRPLVEKYAKELRSSFPLEAYKTIPQLFLPQWGKNYERSLVKMAFVGLETYGWGDTYNFLRQIENGDWDDVLSVSEFQNLDYVNWTSGHRYTFWGFVMYFLGALYNVKNWEVLKQKKHANLLSDFVWGNATSIERWKNCNANVVCFDVWNAVKKASIDFDDFQHIRILFNPQVVIMTCGKRVGRNYLRNTAKKMLWSKEQVDLYKTEDALIFHMPHPNNMRFNKGADFYASIVREGLKEHDLFVPLKQFSDIDMEVETFLKNLVGQLKKNAVSTKDAVAMVASALRKQDACISVRMLCRILNDAGYTTSYGTEYSAGRGSYKMIASVWKHFQYLQKRPDIAEDIALAFTKPNGEYAYCDY